MKPVSEGRDTVRYGNVAQRILKDPVFVDALADLETEYIDRWKQSEDPDERERLHAQVSVLDDVVKQLKIFVDRAEQEKRDAQS